MNVLVIGGGGREHALLSQYNKSKKVKKLIAVPGNSFMSFGLKKPLKIYPSIKPTDKKAIFDIIYKERVGLVDVAQDAPLAEGMVDFLKSKGVKTFGPTKKSAEIEWSKDWSRNFMKKYHLPIPSFAIFSSPKEANNYLKNLPEGSFFIKASGLASGKGAKRAENKKEAVEAVGKMSDFGKAGKIFLIEECLVGEEVSIYALSDGRNFKILKPAQDNKPVGNFDEGPNTGGMGAVAPSLVAEDTTIKNKIETIIRKTIKGMSEEGRSYIGILYLGLIIDKKKNIKIIEFNARWGDPEAQVVLPGVKSDYVDVVSSCVDGSLGKLKIKEDNLTRVCIVGSSKGYPDDYSKVKNKEIFGIKKAAEIEGVTIFGAGIKKVGKKFLASGGRVLNVVGEGKNIFEARSKAYQAISLINIEGNNLYYRTDIGWRDVERKSFNA